MLIVVCFIVQRALTLSMALEEERLRSLMAEQAMQDIRSNSSSIHSAAADVKGQEQDLSDAKVGSILPIYPISSCYSLFPCLSFSL